MPSRSNGKSPLIRTLLAVVGALAGAALFGAIVASMLTLSGPGIKQPLQNPFDASRSAQ